MIDPARPARKNLVLLAAIVVMQVAQPLLGHRSVETGALFDIVFAAICLYVFFVVFAQRWQRRVALTLVLPAAVGNVAHYLLPPSAHLWPAVAFHCSVVVFLGFAVVVILGDIFRKRVISADDVIGALCGYLLGALVWANLYTLTYLLYPEAFVVRLRYRLAARPLAPAPRAVRLPELHHADQSRVLRHQPRRPARLFTHVDGGGLRAVLHGGGGRATGRPQAGPGDEGERPGVDLMMSSV